MSRQAAVAPERRSSVDTVAMQAASRSVAPMQVGGLSNVVVTASGIEFALARDADGDDWARDRSDRGQPSDGDKDPHCGESGIPSRRAPRNMALSGPSAIGAGRYLAANELPRSRPHEDEP